MAAAVDPPVARPPIMSIPAPLPMAPPPPPPPSSGGIAERPVRIAGSIGEDDYPATALRNEEQGRVYARLTIDKRGRVTRCLPDGATATLREATCRLILERFKFRPARNNRRKRVESTVTQPFDWRIPDW